MNLLDLRPVRLAEWRDEEAGVLLLRRPPADRGPRRLGAWVLHWLGAPRLRLDATGSAAWREFDGRTTVREVVASIRAEFGEAAEPVEQRLGSFVRLLHRERLVRYDGPEREAERAHG
ncbi:MAG: PqqD family protein [Gemmatimonadota bacterium]|nr:PqqD family protein [Gemmatimonadota bacterium]